MRISDWGSDVCSSDLAVFADVVVPAFDRGAILFLPRRLARLLHLGGKAGLAGFADVDAELPGLFDQFGIQRDVGRPFRGRLLGPFEARGTVNRERKSVVWGKSGSDGVDLVGRRIINQKKQKQKHNKTKENSK